MAIWAQVLHLWRLVNPRDRVATGSGGWGSVPVPIGTRRVSETSVVWAFLCAAWPSFATFPNTTSSKSPTLLQQSLTPRRLPTASTLSARPRSQKWQTWGRRSDPRIPRRSSCAPSSRKRRRSAKPLLDKIQAAEKRLTTRHKAVEAATAKRDQLQHSLQAARSSHAATGAGSRAHGPTRNGGKLTCRWQRPHRCVRRKLWMRSQKAIRTGDRLAGRCIGRGGVLRKLKDGKNPKDGR